jgi:hypothetical protein
MNHRRSLIVVGALALASACNSFEDPAVVIDLRLLGAIAEPPEVLVPPDPDDIDPLALPEVELCALVADPADSRQLSYAMVACPQNARGRCDADAQPQVDLGSGTVDDPEEADAPVQLCATLGPSPGLAEVIRASVSLDDLQGFGGIDLQVGIAVWPAGSNLDAAEYATKAVRYGAQLPAERTPNQNPYLDSVIVTRAAVGPRGLDELLPVGRCGDVDPVVVAPGEKIGLVPVEPDGVREDYVVPTFEGEVRRFTENLSYQFYATAGGFSPFTTGGPKDLVGNEPPLDTVWTAPDEADEIGAGLDVDLYIVQRDERGGQSWIQSCVRVVP